MYTVYMIGNTYIVRIKHMSNVLWTLGATPSSRPLEPKAAMLPRWPVATCKVRHHESRTEEKLAVVMGIDGDIFWDVFPFEWIVCKLCQREIT